MTHVAMMQPPAQAEPGAGVCNEKLGLWVFLGSEVMSFAALIVAYIMLQRKTIAVSSHRPLLALCRPRMDNALHHRVPDLSE